MSDTDHIYTPKDNSLSERLRAYRSTYEAYINAEASLNLLDNENWKDSLGERREVEVAHEVCRRSIEMAAKDISQDELQEASEQGLLNDKEALELIKAKRQQEVQAIRKDHKHSDSIKHRHKQ